MSPSLDPESAKLLAEARRRTGHLWHSLLPRHKVELFAPQGNGPKFAANFIATWKRMPLWARRRILSHWRSDHELNFTRKPVIELLSDWSSRGRKDLACCARHGFILRFWSKRFDAMPDAVQCDVIAHELAHVHQHAVGWKIVSWNNSTHITVDGNGDELFPGDVEQDADDTMDFWGFDPESVDRWCLEMGFTKTVEAKSMDEYLSIAVNAHYGHGGR